MLYSIINNVDYKTVLSKEIEFGLNQCAKILNHFEFSSINDFLKSSTKKIKQTTSLFEYHIMKTILMINFDEFYELFTKNKLNTQSLEMFVYTKLNTTLIKSKIDSLINSNKFDDSLRMSNIEIYNLKSQNGGSTNNDYYKKYLKYKNKYLRKKSAINI